MYDAFGGLAVVGGHGNDSIAGGQTRQRAVSADGNVVVAGGIAARARAARIEHGIELAGFTFAQRNFRGIERHGFRSGTYGDGFAGLFAVVGGYSEHSGAGLKRRGDRANHGDDGRIAAGKAVAARAVLGERGREIGGFTQSQRGAADSKFDARRRGQYLDRYNAAQARFGADANARAALGYGFHRAVGAHFSNFSFGGSICNSFIGYGAFGGEAPVGDGMRVAYTQRELCFSRNDRRRRYDRFDGRVFRFKCRHFGNGCGAGRCGTAIPAVIRGHIVVAEGEVFARSTRTVIGVGVDVYPHAVQTGDIPGDLAVVGAVNELVFNIGCIQQTLHGQCVAEAVAAAIKQHSRCGVWGAVGVIRRGTVDQLFIEPQRAFPFIGGASGAESLHPCRYFGAQKRLNIGLGARLHRGLCGRLGRRFGSWRSHGFSRRLCGWLGRGFGRRLSSRFCGRLSRRLGRGNRRDFRCRFGCRNRNRVSCLLHCNFIFNGVLRIYGHAAKQQGRTDER